MHFSEKPNLEELRRGRENQAHLHNRYHTRFLIGTIAMILVGIVLFLNQGKTTEIPKPTQWDLELAETLTTIEGRESAIEEKYNGAKIIAERTYGKDIISVFEVDNQHSFCVFEAIKEGYWMEYCGNLFPRTDLVKGTAYLGYNTHQYDIYLQADNAFSYLVITRTNMTQPHNIQQQRIRFDESGIALMKLDPEINDPAPEIVGWDAVGNHYILADGTL